MIDKWFSAQCDDLGGKKWDGICEISNDYAPYSYCITPPADWLVKMDVSITINRKWWWIGFLILVPIVLLLLYPIYKWNAFNLIIGLVICFLFIVYGKRSQRSWLALIIFTIVYEVWYLSLLGYTLVTTDTWYPPDYDFGGHFIMGFMLYMVVASIKPRWNPAYSFIIATIIGILYEVSEWICSTFYAMPNLWWDLENAIFDIRNNMIGSVTAILIEYMIRKLTKCKTVQK